MNSLNEYSTRVIALTLLFACSAIIGAIPMTALHAQNPAAATIYVSTTGSDSAGNGSISSPYATISHAISVAPVGAFIILQPGTYNEMVNITHTVTLESASSQPSNTIINAVGQLFGIEVLGSAASGTTVEGLTVEHADNHGIFVQDAVNVAIENNVVVSNGLHPNNCPKEHPAPGCISENKGIELVGTSYSSVVANLVINNQADGGIALSDDGQLNPGGFKSGASSPSLGNLISGNTIIGNVAGCGIVVAAYNSGEGVVNNIVSYNYVVSGIISGSIVVAADVPHSVAINNSVIYNTVLNNPIPGIVVHSNTPGDIVSGTKIIGNTVSGNGGFGPRPTGINLIGNINGSSIVTNTLISGNILHHEFFGVLAQNATNTVVLADNNFDPSVTMPVQGAIVSQLSLTSLNSDIAALANTIAVLQSSLNQLQSTAAKGSDLIALSNSVDTLTANISSLNSRANMQIGQTSSVMTVAYTALAVAVVLGVLAIVLAVRKRS